MIRSPRDRFVNSSYASDFQKFVKSLAFEEATVAAMMELERDMPLDCTPNQAADAHNQMVGARKYLDKLCTIYQAEQENTEPKHDQLNYEHGV